MPYTTFLTLLESFPIRVDEQKEEQAILNLARKYQLSFYDASYLEVSVRNHLPLATLDRALQSAAAAAGIPLLA